MSQLILASASPRRLALLKQIGVDCRVVPADICEEALADETPTAYTQRLAYEKAGAVRAQCNQACVVLAADTTVSIQGDILGKPLHQQDAMQMLLRLSGQTHQVVTAVAVMSPVATDLLCVTTEVTFADLSETVCADYWRTGEPQDKAGGYAIQGLGALFVKHIHGSYSNVVGLPLYETAELLNKHGIPIWRLEISSY